MEDKFKKQSKCAYCEKEMEASYRSKRFCSDKCRVYFYREHKNKQVAQKPIEKSTKPVVESEKKKPGELTSFEIMRNKRLGL